MMSDDVFVSEVVEADNGLSVRVTVRRGSTEETQSIILHPKSWEDIKREYAVYIAIGQLKQKLGWEFPYPDFAHEIVSNHYFCGADEGSITVLQHTPSGITSRAIHDRGMTGGEALREHNKVFKEFMLLLWEAGIRPQPRKASVKRLGKPRWSEEERLQQEDVADDPEV